MKKLTLEDAWISLTALLQRDRTDTAIKLLAELIEQAVTHQEAEQIANLSLELPQALLQDSLLQRLYAALLCRSRKTQPLLQYLDSVAAPTPELQLYRAWALLRLGESKAALELLESIKGTSQPDQGLFWRTKAEALYRQGYADWQTAFLKARNHLSGSALGRSLLDEGSFLFYSGQQAAARVVWSESLAHLRGDIYYLAWVRYNLGTALIKDRPQEAETHFLEAVRLSGKQVAQEFRARALCGLASVRRSFGEWERALYSYLEASQIPGDPDDHQQALWGYAHTLRLLGRVEEALAQLIVAHQIEPSPSANWLYADLAAAKLMLEDIAGAKESLARATRLGERGSIISHVARAVILHRGGEFAAAQTLLAGLDPQNLWVREELHCFPELKAYFALPESPIQRQRWVEVNPFGLLEVRVNGRPVPISPTGRPGELLVLLLENGKSAGLEGLLDRLFDQSKGKAKDRKALWATVQKLRQALGWKQSVQLKRGIYQLDPSTQWHYHGKPTPEDNSEFLPGHFSNWVQEKRIGLMWVV